MLKRILQSVFGNPSHTVVLQSRIQELEKHIKYLQEHPVVKEVKVDHFTFTPESYRKFKGKLEAPICSSNTTPTQAAYFLGISRVLSVLEDEHVTNR